MQPPLAPPLDRSPSAVASRLNARFAAGLLSPEPQPPGILVHQLDGTIPQSTPWLVGSDRISSSIINSYVRVLFNRGPSLGFVLALPHVSSVLCAWGSDGGTSNRNCDSSGASKRCVPGCSGPEGWCEDRDPLSNYDWYCPWRPSNLHKMVEMQQHAGGGDHYNEVILNASAWRRSMPSIVEAVFYTSGGDPDGVARVREQARGVQELLADHFDTTMPLLQLELQADEGTTAAWPFTVVDPATGASGGDARRERFGSDLGTS